MSKQAEKQEVKPFYPLPTTMEIVPAPARPILFQQDPPPVRWLVTVSVVDPLTKKAIICARHECESLGHARTLLTEIREMAEDVSEFLPGVSAEGWELQTF